MSETTALPENHAEAIYFSASMFGQQEKQTLEKAEKRFHETVEDFSKSIEKYKEATKTFLVGRFVDMDQVIQVGDIKSVKNVQSSGRSSLSIQCPASGVIDLYHTFQCSIATVPIPNTYYKAYESAEEWWKSDNVVAEGRLNSQGRTKLIGLTPGKNYEICFSPQVTEKDLSRLYTFYDVVIKDMRGWLTEVWETEQRQAWIEYINQGESIDVKKAMKKFADGIVGALKDLWDVLTKLFDILTNPGKYAQKIKDALSVENLKKFYNESTESASEMLTILTDEALLFITAMAGYSYFCLLTPQDIVNDIAEQLGALLIQIVVYAVVPAGIAQIVLDMVTSIL